MKWKKTKEGLILTSSKNSMSLNCKSKLNYMNLLMKKKFKRNMNLNLSPICVLDQWKLWADITEEKYTTGFMIYQSNKTWDLKQQRYIWAAIQKQLIIQKFKNIQSKWWEKEILETVWFKMLKWETFDSKTERKSKRRLKNSFENKSKSTNQRSLMKTDFWKNIFKY